jgi:hypothetical protein
MTQEPRRRVCTRRAGSHLAGIVHEYVDTPGGEILNVRDGCLSFRAAESALNCGEVVKVQYRDKVIAGRSGRRRNGTLAHFIFPQTSYLLGDRNVLRKIMFVECCCFLRSLYITTS